MTPSLRSLLIGSVLLASCTAPRAVGGQDAEQRLRTVIRQGLAVPPPDNPDAKALPPDFAAFSAKGYLGGNMSGNESEFTQLCYANWKLLASLADYSSSSKRIEFEKRMIAEKTVPALRLLYAAVAASAGSEKAALEIFESMKSTEYDTVLNTLSALTWILHHSGSNPPSWIVEMAMAAVADDRYVTGMEKTDWAPGTLFCISYLADEYEDVVRSLGSLKCLAAVPLLLERLEKTDASRGYIMALHSMGDERAIPPLVKFLEKFGKDEQSEEEAGGTDRLGRLMLALGALKARAAVPLLVKHLEHPEAIAALEWIGDRSVVPALRALVQAKGAISEWGKKIEWGDEDRLAAARLALAVLEEGDPLPRLWDLLQDLSLGEFDRRDVLSRLHERPDPRTIPILVKAIKTDPSGAVVNPCIEVLASFRFPEAVDGLIECFDADFEGKSDWKRAYKPEMFRENIAKSLRALTGMDFPADKKPWADWWNANRSSFQK